MQIEPRGWDNGTYLLLRVVSNLTASSFTENGLTQECEETSKTIIILLIQVVFAHMLAHDR